MQNNRYSLYIIKDQVITLVIRELKLKYKNTFLGFFWSLLMPLSQTLVFFLIFGVYIRFNTPNYVLYLMTGLFVWQCFSNTIAQGIGVFLGNGNLIKKLPCRRDTFVWSMVISEFIHFALTIPIVLAVMIFSGIVPDGNLLLIPIVMLELAFFCVGLVLLVGTVQMFLRDMERIVAIILQLWFYMTPIFYPAEIIPQEYRFTLYLNPMYYYIEEWRHIFCHAQFDPLAIPGGLLWACGIFAFGNICYHAGNKKFAEVI